MNLPAFKSKLISVWLLSASAILSPNWCSAEDADASVSSVVASSLSVQAAAVNAIESAGNGQTAKLDVPIVESASESVADPVVIPFYEQKKTALTTSTASSIGSSSHLLSVTLGLAAIIGLIFLLSFFAKRFGSGAFLGNNQLKIVSTLPLGTRERIVLLDAGGQQLLLGITPTHINTLHVFAEPIAIIEKAESSSDFSQKLMAILQQKPASGTPNNNSAQQG
jgi:flagellar protein FliO/FliZ